MENLNNPAPEVTPSMPVGNPAPAPAPAPVVDTPAPAPAGAPVYAEGGKVGFFGGLKPVDIIVGAFAVAALTLTIYYYRKKIRHASREYPELRADVDELKDRFQEEQQ